MNALTTALTAAGAGVLLLIVIALIYAVFLATPVWLLWNALMPVLFGLTKLGWWQAFGLALLTRLMFASTTSSSTQS